MNARAVGQHDAAPAEQIERQPVHARGHRVVPAQLVHACDSLRGQYGLEHVQPDTLPTRRKIEQFPRAPETEEPNASRGHDLAPRARTAVMTVNSRCWYTVSPPLEGE